MEIKGYVMDAKCYHPECLPVNSSSVVKGVTHIYTKEDMHALTRKYGIRGRCSRCGFSIFPRK